MDSRYCLISPVRGEARFVQRTLDSVAAQSVRPAFWIIVDDGSKDAPPQILAESDARFSFIRRIRRDDSSGRKLGGGVIDALYTGVRDNRSSPVRVRL